MDFPTVLLRDLLQLSSRAGLDDDALGAPLVALMDGLQVAVPSFRGLHLTIVDNSHPVSLTAFLPLHDGDSINTSLRVAFAALGPGFDSDSHVIYYAATPGAFVDLAADFGYALALATPIITASTSTRSADNTVGNGHEGRDHTDGDSQHGRDQTDGDGQHGDDQADGDGQDGPGRRDGDWLIVLDADLPPPTTRSGLSGLDERSMIDRAIGVMIDQGHHPDDAHATLRRHAAAGGVEPHIHAARLVRD